MFNRPDRFHVPDKNPEYQYVWLNSNEQNLIEEVKYRGWEIVQGTPENPILGVGNAAPGQSTEAPTGGVTRTRGDVILARMPKKQYEETILAEERANRDRQGAAYDAMIDQSNEKMRRAARDAGISNIPRQIVFRSDVTSPTDDPSEK